jgi:hypothetical protein
MRIAAAAGLAAVLAGCGLGGPTAVTTPRPGPTSSPIQAASAPRITPPSVTPPAPPGTNLPAFTCADASGGTGGSANVTGVRVSESAGFDRFVMQFDGPVPTYTVKRQAKPIFKTDASGQSVALTGLAGTLVQVHSASGASTYSGPRDFANASFAVLSEARLTGDFEGYVSWGLGLSRPACVRTFTLKDPARLVVDFTTASS